MNVVSKTELQHYNERLQRRENSEFTHIWDLLDTVCDPEIPVLSLWDLGVLCDIEMQQDTLIVTLTPTYSGCPAMDVMRSDITDALNCNDYPNIEIRTRLSPAWSSQWLSPQGREKMQQLGIAAPDPAYCFKIQQGEQPLQGIACPRCGSTRTQQITEFGTTACKALHQCQDCLEPFDYFKSI